MDSTKTLGIDTYAGVMSESVHAVLARKKQVADRSVGESSEHPTTVLTNNHQPVNTSMNSTDHHRRFGVEMVVEGADRDDDDDIDIIETESDHQSTIASDSIRMAFPSLPSTSVGSSSQPNHNNGGHNNSNSSQQQPLLVHSFQTHSLTPTRPLSPRLATGVSGFSSRPSPALFDQQYEKLRNIRPNVISIQTDESIRVPSPFATSGMGSDVFEFKSNNSQHTPVGATMNHHHPHSTANTSGEPPDEWRTVEPGFELGRDRLRRALRYFFMSPMDKWRIKGRFPWKLLFQVIKIVLVTVQVILFGHNVTLYKSNNISQTLALHSMLLESWDTAEDFKLVPPTEGPYAVYTKDAVWSHVNFAIMNYANIQQSSVGVYGYQLSREKVTSAPLMSPIDVCFERYINSTLNPSYGEYFLDSTLVKSCLTIDNLYPPGDSRWNEFSIVDYLNQNNRTDEMQFDSLVSIALKLPLRTIILNDRIASSKPECFDLDTSVRFNNHPHSGEIRISMHIQHHQFSCLGNLESHTIQGEHTHNIHLFVNIVVFFLCIISLLLCIRSLWRGQQMRKRTVRFFALAFRKQLETRSTLHFVDGWILMILLNDLLLISGTSLNLLRLLNLLGARRFTLRPMDWDNLCSALLGLGNLLVWFGVLRYLAFFSKYNILIVTIKHSLPRVMRFLLCALVLYCGFCFSGWIILGAFHWKFQTLARTSECLFALLNGDDVFATFAYLQEGSLFVWWFSRLYLYTYVLLFIYIVLSLFIAILMDSYETIKEHHQAKPGTRKGALLFASDPLARFINSLDPNELDQNLEGYRLSLLRDEEAEFEDSRRERHHSATSNSSAGCHCCACHILAAFFAPFRWSASAARYAYDKLRSSNTEDPDDQDDRERLSIN